LQILHGAGNHAAKKPCWTARCAEFARSAPFRLMPGRWLDDDRKSGSAPRPQVGDRPMSLIRRNLQGIPDFAENPPHDAGM
jgi:hypothetical protein